MTEVQKPTIYVPALIVSLEHRGKSFAAVKGNANPDAQIVFHAAIALRDQQAEIERLANRLRIVQANLPSTWTSLEAVNRSNSNLRFLIDEVLDHPVTELDS